MIDSKSFHTAFIQAGEILFEETQSRFHTLGKKERTELMGDLLARTMTALNLTNLILDKEFYRYDWAILDNSKPVGDKIDYRQPLHVLALIEHENGRNPEEEFWKLLHYYSPLKILIFYSKNPERNLCDFSTTYGRISAFHRRNDSECYLAICGTQESDAQPWKAWTMCKGQVWKTLPHPAATTSTPR